MYNYIVAAVYSTCPDDICKASYNAKGAILRADDGDVFIPAVFGSSYNCTNHSALCIDNDCSACKCKTQQDTWKDSHSSCKNINSKSTFLLSYL